ncbi:MAG: quinone-dependent dihydroorotate dehydrogenase, partial [Methylophilus sp.]
MNVYPLLKPLLFKLDAERVHDLTLTSLKRAEDLGLLRWAKGHLPDQSRQVMGLNFPNPVGLAAGLDKNAMVIDGMAALGFGFLEVGTVTPRAQPGNPQP